MQILVQSLRDSKSTVEHIKLAKNFITDAGALKLIQFLSTSSTVHTLNLTNNQCTEATLENIKQCMSNIPIQKNIILYKNRISSNNNTQSQVQMLKTLGVYVSI